MHEREAYVGRYPWLPVLEAVIVEDLNYYYKVKIYNEDGEEKEGFVAKKNVEIIDSTDSK